MRVARRNSGGGRAAPASASGAVASAPLPETYLVVQRADAVRVLYILLYCDAARVARTTRVNWCTVVVVLYAAFLVGKALLAALKQHRY
jgi:poly[ADP-ribose] polymerase 16